MKTRSPIRGQSDARLSMLQATIPEQRHAPAQSPSLPPSWLPHLTSSTASQAAHTQIQACYFSSIHAQCNILPSKAPLVLYQFCSKHRTHSHQNQSAYQSSGLSLSTSVLFPSFSPFAVLYSCCTSVSK